MPDQTKAAPAAPGPAKAQKQDRPVSAHRAFLYAMALPGWGEWYAGRKQLGAATFGLLCLALLWFTWMFVLYITDMMQGLQGALLGLPLAEVSPNLFYLFGASGHSLYVVWMWAMLAGVQYARERRVHENLPGQRSSIWGLVMAWVCPGCGHAYQGKAALGYLFFGAYSVIALCILPVYFQFSRDLKAMLGDQDILMGNTHTVVSVMLNALGELSMRVDFSPASLFKVVLRSLAVADTAIMLYAAKQAAKYLPSQAGGQTEERPAPKTRAEAMVAEAARHEQRVQGTLPPVPWHKRPFVQALGYWGASWLCPGAGQMLQGRGVLGWVLLGLYFLPSAALSAVLHLDLIDPSSVGWLAHTPGIVKWAVMFEALIWWLWIGNNRDE
ncbi:MAG: hypothetical protein D6E12_07265 [Desulfovibrio sp.]|nr:MAG: hypothetical protein D6E12_07265 [Desulfovibrio sp.]